MKSFSLIGVLLGALVIASAQLTARRSHRRPQDREGGRFEPFGPLNRSTALAAKPRTRALGHVLQPRNGTGSGRTRTPTPV